MNRIILIGNGFDLAHGLKTSYTDFITDYWEQIIDDLFLKFRFGGEIAYLTPKFRPESDYKNNEILIKGIPYNQSLHFDYDPSKTGFELLLSIILHLYENIEDHIIFTNKFFSDLTLNKLLYNWVDIEEAYYQSLNNCLDGGKNTNIQELNRDFNNVKILLEKYLIKQSLVYIEKDPHIGENMYMPFPKMLVDSLSKDNFPENILLLSFNYTSTENKYLSRPNNTEVIHIHGELNNPKNPIIFGYGDETDERYKRIEDKNDNDYLENVKTFQYLETNNYRKTLLFLDSGEYQIFVMGHSCGLSDRTLLKTIFEHKNCKSIQVFYYQESEEKDNYQNIARNISRCFTENALMREKLVNKQESWPFR